MAVTKTLSEGSPEGNRGQGWCCPDNQMLRQTCVETIVREARNRTLVRSSSGREFRSATSEEWLTQEGPVTHSNGEHGAPTVTSMIRIVT